MSLGSGLAGDTSPVWGKSPPQARERPGGLTASTSLEDDPASGAEPEGEFYHSPPPAAR